MNRREKGWDAFRWAVVTTVWLVSTMLLAGLCSGQSHGVFGERCNGVTLTHGGGEPKLNTTNFETQLGSRFPAVVATLNLGQPLPAALPVFLCRWYVDVQVIACGGTDLAGMWIVRWVIPNNPRLIGLVVTEQFLVYDAQGVTWWSSNAGWWRVQP